MRTSQLARCARALWLCAAALAAAAAHGGPFGDGPLSGVSVRADHAEFDARAGIVRYRGDVHLRHHERKISFRGETLSARVVDNRLVRLVATGSPAALRQYDEDTAIPEDESAGDATARFSARAERIVYDTVQGIVEMTGSVRVSQRGMGELRSGHVRYAIDERRLVAGEADSGRSRSQVLIHWPAAR